MKKKACIRPDVKDSRKMLGWVSFRGRDVTYEATVFFWMIIVRNLPCSDFSHLKYALRLKRDVISYESLYVKNTSRFGNALICHIAEVPLAPEPTSSKGTHRSVPVRRSNLPCSGAHISGYRRSFNFR